MTESGSVPVTLLTGFLGAGKTTLVNRILSEEHGVRCAVIVNEFGPIGVDGKLIVRAEEELIELANGCVCCTVRGDLVEAVGRLLARRRRRFFRGEPFERILIETSGLASPGPILQSFQLDDVLRDETRIETVVCVAHAGLFEQQLGEHPEAEEQLGYADVVLLNHADRIAESGLDAMRAEVLRRNPRARVLSSIRAEAPLDVLLEPAEDDRPRPDLGSDQAAHAGAHTEGAGAVVLRSDDALDLATLKMWLQFVASKRDHAPWRIKGVLRCRDHAGPVVVQAVHQYLELGPGEGDAPEESILTLIGRGLDEAELTRGWDACRRA